MRMHCCMWSEENLSLLSLLLLTCYCLLAAARLIKNFNCARKQAERGTATIVQHVC
jgi:hypothetical protein